MDGGLDRAASRNTGFASGSLIVRNFAEARVCFAGQELHRDCHALNLVEPMGFEPTTSSMPSRRAPNCATAPPQDTAKC
jgi:hypothetical protein